MRQLAALATLVALLSAWHAAALIALADDPPSDRPRSDANDPAAGVDPNVMAILEAQHAAWQAHRSWKAELTYTTTDMLERTVEQRKGLLALIRGTDEAPGQFAIHFDTVRRGLARKVRGQLVPTYKLTVRDELHYAFDGQWFTIVKTKARQITRKQLARKGQRIQPLRLGEGPFPMPFGQAPRDVLAYFDPELVAPAQGDPNNADHLRLLTKWRRRKELDFLMLELWIDRDTKWPVQMHAVHGKRLRRPSKTTTVSFSDIRTDVDLPERLFHPPSRPGYSETKVPLDKPARRGEQAVP